MAATSVMPEAAMRMPFADLPAVHARRRRSRGHHRVMPTGACR